jgi:uncharacterized protein (DUF58 family)
MSSTGASGTDRVRLTPVGWLVLGEALVLISSRWWPAQSLPEPATLSLGLALIAGVAFARFAAPRGVARATGRWLIEPRVPMGEEVTVGAQLGCESGLPPTMLLAWNPTTRRSEPAARLRAVAPGTARATWTARFPRRGVFQLPPLVLHCSQPFGVVAVERQLGPGCEVVVLPTVGSLRKALRERLDTWFAEMTPTAEAGADELDHLRGYRPGDSMRAIHWRATARHGSLLVAERQDPACRRVALVLDTSGRGVTGPLDARLFEKLVAAVATVADAVLRRGWQVTVHGGFAPAGVQGELPRLLEALALAAPDGSALTDTMPQQPAIVVFTARPGDVPAGDRPPLVVPLDDLDRLIRLPLRMR